MKVVISSIISLLITSSALASVAREHCLVSDDGSASCFIEIEDEGKSQFFTSYEDFESLFLDPRVVSLNVEFSEVSGEEYSQINLDTEPTRFVYDNQQINVYDFDYSTGNCVQDKPMSLAGWWDSWGRCTAGTLGGAGLGGLAGAGFGPVGIGVGVVSGGLAGAAASCGSTVVVRYRDQTALYTVNC